MSREEKTKDDSKSVDVLMTKYSLLRGEIQTYINLFHQQTNFLTVFVSSTAGLAGVAALWAMKDPKVAEKTLYELSGLTLSVAGGSYSVVQLAVFFAYLLTLFLGFYFLSAAIGYMYIIEVICQRTASIERQVNALLGQRLLLWDSEITPNIIRGGTRRGIWITPSKVRIGCAIAILIFIFVAQAITAIPLMGLHLGITFLFVLGTASSFQALQLSRFRSHGVSVAAERINETVPQPTLYRPQERKRQARRSS